MSWRTFQRRRRVLVCSILCFCCWVFGLFENILWISFLLLFWCGFLSFEIEIFYNLDHQMPKISYWDVHSFLHHPLQNRLQIQDDETKSQKKVKWLFTLTFSHWRFLHFLKLLSFTSSRPWFESFDQYLDDVKENKDKGLMERMFVEQCKKIQKKRSELLVSEIYASRESSKFKKTYG